MTYILDERLIALLSIATRRAVARSCQVSDSRYEEQPITSESLRNLAKVLKMLKQDSPEINNFLKHCGINLNEGQHRILDQCAKELAEIANEWDLFDREIGL